VAWILQRQGPQVMRQGKDDMRVWRLEPLAFPGGEPRRLGRTVTFGTAAVPARVLRLHFVPTVVALGDVAPEGGSPAHGDGP